MKKIYIGILLLITAFSANAQMPGFMGRRIDIGYDLLLSPHLQGGEFNGGTFGIPLNLRMGIHADYAKNRSWTLGLGYTLLQTSFGIYQTGYYSPNSTYLDLATDEHQFNQLSHNIVFRAYKSRGSDLAPPLGFFYGVEAGVGIVVANDKYGSYPDLDGKFKKGRSIVSICPHFDLVFGRKMAISNRWLFNTSVNFGLAATSGALLLSVIDDASSETLVDINKRARRSNSFRYYSQEIISLNFGISYLIK